MVENLSKEELRDIIQDLYKEFNDEKIRLTAMIADNNTHIKESDDFIENLSKEHEDNFNIFSPRSIKVDHTKKIKEIRNHQEELKKENQSIEDKLNYYNQKVEQLDRALNSKEEQSPEDTSILLLQEMEKQRISRDLHDTTVQNLTHMIHKTELCMKYMDTDLIKAKLELELVHEGIKSIIDELRTTIFRLRPSAFDDINFLSAIDQVIEELKKNTDIKILYQVDGNYDNIEEIILISLIRIMQEACNNAIKYSEAKEVKINFKIIDNQIHLVIEDNGKGIDLRTKSNKDIHNGFGLSIMKERAKALNGSIDIRTKKNHGTSIIAVIPIEMKGEHKCQSE